MSEDAGSVFQLWRADDTSPGLIESQSSTTHADPVSEADLLIRLLRLLYSPARAAQLADRLLATFKSLDEVMHASSRDLTRIPGIDRRAALLLQCQGEMSDLLALRRAAPLPRIGRSADLRAYLVPRMACMPVETARAILLDARNRVIGEEEVARGTVNGVTLYPREVARLALMRRATALVIAHNHPSGDPQPSEADVELTHQLHFGLAALSIALQDHLVIGRTDVFSFREAGLLPGAGGRRGRRLGGWDA